MDNRSTTTTEAPMRGSSGAHGLARLLRERILVRLAWPEAQAWLEFAAVTVGFALVALPAARAADLLPGGGPAPPWRLALLLVVPALSEELLFRALLLPARPRWPWRGALLALALYVAAHPLLAWWMRPAAFEMFSAPTFLLLAALLGAGATALTLRHRSIWPGVALHALVVVAWGVGGGLPPLA